MKDGYVLKSSLNSEEELMLVNKLTRRNFSKDEIYIFSVVLCDNEIDRDNERFTNESLEKLEKMYVGKTGILDHDPKSENQTARIFKCFLEDVKGKKNSLNQPYKRLVAKAYMPKCSKNENIILEIDSGIKKEVSVGCQVEKKICSICGFEMKKGQCSHIKGAKYKVNGKFQTCHAILENPLDAYEWSFVAVPAQREAGVIKSYKKNHLKGGDIKLEEIMKNLGFKGYEKMSEEETNKFYSALKSLKEKAKVGEIYHEELKNEVVKLSGIIQPELELSVIKGICEKISFDELKSLRKAFKSKLSQIIPASPQFTPEKEENSLTQNLQFKI